MSKLLAYLTQRFSLHDGNGIRTNLFLKGCPLRCQWCQNPESLSFEKEMSFNINNCIGCGLCESVCDHDAISMSNENRIVFDNCIVCEECANICPNNAIEVIGGISSVEDIAEDLLRDKSFFKESGGGVTISGGEPLIQSQGLKDLLKVLKSNEVDTLIETSGHVPWSNFEDVLEFVEEFYIDLKSSPSLHKELTGVDQNLYILPNIKRLSTDHPDIKVSLRMPVIPGINDDENSIDDISELMKNEFGHSEIQLLQYHRLYENKLENINTDQSNLGIIPNEESILTVREMFLKNDILAHLPEDIEDSSTEYDFPKPEVTDRVLKLLDEVKHSDLEMCVERVKYITEFYKKESKSSSNNSSQVIRAKMLDHILKNKSKIIYDDELIIGNYTSKRVSGNLFMELHGLGVIEDLLSFSTRKTNPWKCTLSQKWEIIKSIPFWLRNNVLVKELGFIKYLKIANRIMKGYEFVLNEAGGFSHFCPSYERLLFSGTEVIINEAKELRNQTDDNERKDFYESVMISCQALEEFSESYSILAEELAESIIDNNDLQKKKRKKELLEISKICRRVPKLPPRNIQEALQCIFFWQLGVTQEGLDIGIAPGRLDIVLYPYYKMTKESGLMNDEEIFELLCCFWLKLGEIAPLFNDRITNVHGGLFNGQTINIAGLDREGNECTNELSFLFLEVADAMRTRMPNFYVRYNESTSSNKLMKRASRMIRDGAAMPAVANDQKLIDMLHNKRGVSIEDARDYILLGCVEPVICGKSYYSTDTSLNNLPLCLERSLLSLIIHDQKKQQEHHHQLPKNMEEVFELYQFEVEKLLDDMLYSQEIIERALQNHAPTPLTSVTLDGCIENGVDASSGGSKYNGSGNQGVGAPDVADSLAAIEQVVFKDQRCELDELIMEMSDNFQSERGNVIRGYLLQAPKYGNDDPFVDKWMTRVVKSFSDLLTRRYNKRGDIHVAGWYSVTIHEAFGSKVGAIPSGRLKGQPFSSGLSPTNGSAILGPTATLGSAARIDIIDYAGNGVNVNLQLQDSFLIGEKGVETVQALLEGYFSTGGIQVQFNVLDPQILIKARKNPSLYPNLLVRVSGYSAYFRDLSPMMQDEIVGRYCKKNCL